VKGDDARKEGYHIVIDTVEPADNKSRTWRHPWQLGINAPNIAIRENDRSATAVTPGAALQILPVGDMYLRVIQGQEKPELLGWRIYDTIAKPWPVPTYEWRADQTFSRAWIIQMQATEAQWPVLRIEPVGGDDPGELRFKVLLRNGDIDHVFRRFPGQPRLVFDQEMVTGDLVIHRRDQNGGLSARLETLGGMDSVAKPSRHVGQK
jgi:hypothetical protein